MICEWAHLFPGWCVGVVSLVVAVVVVFVVLTEESKMKEVKEEGWLCSYEDGESTAGVWWA